MKNYQLNRPVWVNSKLAFPNYKLAFVVSETAKTVFWQFSFIKGLELFAVWALSLLQNAVSDKFCSSFLRLCKLFQVTGENYSLPTGEITRKGLSSSRMGGEFGMPSTGRAA